MPSTSPKQHRFMEAVAHSPKFAKKADVPQSVGKEFAAADKKRPPTSIAASTDGGMGTGRKSMTTPATLPPPAKQQTAKPVKRSTAPRPFVPKR